MHTLDHWGLASDASVAARARCRPTQGQGLGPSPEGQAACRLSSSWGPWLSAHTHVAAVSHPGTHDGSLDGSVQGQLQGLAASEPRGARQ